MSIHRASPRTVRRIALAIAVTAVLSACRPTTSPATSGGGSADGSPGGNSTPGPIRTTPIDGHVTGQVPTSCHGRQAADGRPLPDPMCTPGVASDQVNQTTIATTICTPGYTKTIRPPEADTEAFKKKILAAYGATHPLGAYELDHLIPLEVGGSNDAGNLWPELNDHPQSGVLNSKDLVENALHKAVCAHQVTLTAAQQAIATDWTTALRTLGLPPAR